MGLLANAGLRSLRIAGRSLGSAQVCALLLLAFLGLGGQGPALADERDPKALAFFRDAVEQRHSGAYDSAVIQLKNALQLDPDYDEARALLGELYVELGDGESAEKELLAALALGVPADKLWIHLSYAKLLQGRYEEVLQDLDLNPPASARAAEGAILRGEALYGLKRRAEAAEVLGQATQLDPENPRAFVRLAEILAALREHDEAERQVDLALEIDPGLVRALLLKAELRRLDRDTEAAMALFDKALELAPHGVAARLGRITVLIDLEENALAKTEIEALRTGTVEHPMIEYLDAVILARERQFKEAQTTLMRLGGSLDDYPPALLFRATLHYAMSELEQSRSLLGRLLTIEPESLPAEKLLAATLIKQGAAAEASTILEASLTRAPDDPQLLLLLGSAYLHLEDFAAATRSLEQALALSPGNLRSVMQLAFGQLTLGYVGDSATTPDQDEDQVLLKFFKGLALLQSREFEQALTLAQDLETSQAGGPLALYVRAGALFGLDRRQEARAAFKEVVAKAPTFLPAKINLARLHLRDGELELAEALVAEVLQRNPGNTQATMMMAEIARRSDHWAKAFEWLQRAVAQTPNLVEPQIALIRLHIDSGELAKARERAVRADANFPANARVLALRAEIELRNGNSGEALPLLGRLIEMEPDVPTHRYRLAEAYLGEGDRRAAKQQLQRLIDRDPQQLTAHLRLVDLELADGAGDVALEQVERMREAFPEAAAVDQVLGQVLMRLERPAEALEAFERAWFKGRNGELAIARFEARAAAGQQAIAPFAELADWLEGNPGDGPTRLFLAGKLLDAGHHDEAINHYEILLAARPEDPLLLNNLAWLYHQKQDGRDIHYAERALSFAPSEAAIMDTLGWILLNRGHLERAKSILENAASRAPNNPEIVYHFAAALERSGRREEAKTLLSRILTEHRAFASADAAQALMKKLEAN